MRFRVIWIVILIREDRVRRLTYKALCHLVIGAWVFRRNGGGRNHHLSPVGTQQQNLFIAHLSGHDEDGLITFERRRDGKTDTRVT